MIHSDLENGGIASFSAAPLVLNIPGLQLQSEAWLEFDTSGWNRLRANIQVSLGTGPLEGTLTFNLEKRSELAIIYKPMLNTMNIISWDNNRIEGEEIKIYFNQLLKTRQSFALMGLAFGLKCFPKEFIVALYIFILNSLNDEDGR